VPISSAMERDISDMYASSKMDNGHAVD